MKTARQQYRDHQSGSCGSRNPDPAAKETAGRNALLGHSLSNARQQGRRHLGVYNPRHAVIDGGEKSLLLRERGRTCRARGEMRARVSVKGSTARGVLQTFLIGFAKHCNFSASSFRAKNRRDFTVPAGISSSAATSSVVWPSIADSRSTSLCLSGSCSIAASNRA